MRRSLFGTWVLLGLILAITLGLRLSTLWTTYDHPDEVIALGVTSGVLNGTLDTNWAHHDVGRFNYPSFNFSAYHLSLAAIDAVPSWFWGTSIERLRLVSAAFFIVSIGLTWLLGSCLSNDEVGLIAAAFTALSPQLFQDSLYARPETWLTAIFLFALVIVTLPPYPARQA
jgi:hypothetical protein